MRLRAPATARSRASSGTVRSSNHDVRLMAALATPCRFTIEKPAAGGTMIARLDGQSCSLPGASPRRRVTARVREGRPRAFCTRTTHDGGGGLGGFAGCPPAIPSAVAASTARQLPAAASAQERRHRRCLRQDSADHAAVARDVTPSPEDGYRMRAPSPHGGRRYGFSARDATTSAMRVRRRNLLARLRRAGSADGSGQFGWESEVREKSSCPRTRTPRIAPSAWTRIMRWT